MGLHHMLLLEMTEVEGPVRVLQAPSEGEGISDQTDHVQVEIGVQPSGR
jgi:hypothetical protein